MVSFLETRETINNLFSSLIQLKDCSGLRINQAKSLCPRIDTVQNLKLLKNRSMPWGSTFLESTCRQKKLFDLLVSCKKIIKKKRKKMLICSTTTKDNELTTRDVIGVISIIRNYI